MREGTIRNKTGNERMTKANNNQTIIICVICLLKFASSYAMTKYTQLSFICFFFLLLDYLLRTRHFSFFYVWYSLIKWCEWKHKIYISTYYIPYRIRHFKNRNYFHGNHQLPHRTVVRRAMTGAREFKFKGCLDFFSSAFLSNFSISLEMLIRSTSAWF